MMTKSVSAITDWLVIAKLSNKYTNNDNYDYAQIEICCLAAVLAARVEHDGLNKFFK